MICRSGPASATVSVKHDGQASSLQLNDPGLRHWAPTDEGGWIVCWPEAGRPQLDA
ncbi:MAG: hypothetical protein KTR15_15375 [Phycisphaeraceae bacterium]|nr:hypothetical protein [Phycisphaeraceae bacterium]